MSMNEMMAAQGGPPLTTPSSWRNPYGNRLLGPDEDYSSPIPRETPPYDGPYT
jgi:hypothetical protein